MLNNGGEEMGKDGKVREVRNISRNEKSGGGKFEGTGRASAHFFASR